MFSCRAYHVVCDRNEKYCLIRTSVPEIQMQREVSNGRREKKTGRREEMQIAAVMKAETLAVTHEQSLTDA